MSTLVTNFLRRRQTRRLPAYKEYGALVRAVAEGDATDKTEDRLEELRQELGIGVEEHVRHRKEVFRVLKLERQMLGDAEFQKLEKDAAAKAKRLAEAEEAVRAAKGPAEQAKRELEEQKLRRQNWPPQIASIKRENPAAFGEVPLVPANEASQQAMLK